MSRLPYHHGDLATALLDAAESVLADRGLHGFTLRECARRANVSHAAPKHHFGDIRGLLTALATRGFNVLTSQLRSALAEADGNLAQEFAATARAYALFAEAQPEHFRIMFRSDLLNMDDPELCATMGGTYTELTNVIRRQRGETELTTEGLPQLSGDELLGDILIGWCFIHGYAHLQLEGQLSVIGGDRQDDIRNAAALRLSALVRKDRGP